MKFDLSMVLSWLKTREGILVSTFIVGLLGLMSYSGLLSVWIESEEYGHGLMVVGVLVYLVHRRWQYFGDLGNSARVVAWIAALIACAMVLAGVGSGISLIAYYGVWLFAVAFVLSFGGWRFLRKLVVPFLIVVLLFPLPNPFGPMLTAELQLLSSKFGVWFIRLMGGTVFLEGNVLDMGGSKLLVAEACAGLRYLFPLMSLGGIVALVIHAPKWVKWLLFLVTIPITVFMNSFRIAVTGMLVESGGTAHTEGFLHFFEGWVVFVAATIVFLAVAWLLLKLLPEKQSLFDALSLELPETGKSKALPQSRAFPFVPVAGVSVFILLALIALTLMASRGEVFPQRKLFDEFPSNLGGWEAHRDRLPLQVEGVAGASEYFYADFRSAEREAVNVYVAYYETQRHGQIPHSPKVCIPGGGWTIDSLEPVSISGNSGVTISVNRLVISRGGKKVLTYYWLKQGDKVYRQEFLGRLALIRFSLAENRTDGALVRMVSEVLPGEDMSVVDARLQKFARDFVDVLPDFVPD